MTREMKQRQLCQPPCSSLGDESEKVEIPYLACVAADGWVVERTSGHDQQAKKIDDRWLGYAGSR